VEHKDGLRALESRLVECAVAGEELDCAPTGTSAAELEEIDDWDDREIRAEVLVALCTGELPDRSVHPRRGLRLRGAYITGQVDLSRAQMTECPLAFHTCRFEENVVLYQATTSDMNFTSCALLSLIGDEFNSTASLHLTGTHLRQMSFAYANFRGLVRLSDVHLINPGGTALRADGMNARGVRLNGTRVAGEASLLNVDLRAELDCSEGTALINAEGYALNAERCQVGNALLFRLQEACVGRINLAHAQIGTLADDLASWSDTHSLVGFSYHTLGGDENVDRRLEWISNSTPFSPYVYTQLAEVYRRSGREGFARQVAIRREKERRRQPDLSWGGRAWNRFLDLTVAYGYQPWRALVPLVVFFLLGWFLFTLPPAQEVMVHSSTNIKGAISAAVCHEPYPCFSPPVYVLDTLLPIVDLHQESKWAPARPQPWGVWYEVLTYLLIASGWILTTAVVAGIGSLWRRE
jgi:hypothetical protein